VTRALIFYHYLLGKDALLDAVLGREKRRCLTQCSPII